MISEQHAVLLEELRVSEEEIRVQAEELAEAQFAASRERDRYRQLFEDAPAAYLVTDAHGAIRQVNRATAALLGRRPERLIGKPLAAFVPLNSRTQFRHQLQAVRQAAAATPVRFRISPRNGGEVQVNGTAAAVVEHDEIMELRWLLSPRGASVEIPAQVDDRIETLTRAKQRAERSAAEVAELLAWASHELRTPAASIGGYSDILALGVRGMLTPDQQAILVRIQQAQAHMVSLLEDLVTFARAGAGHLRYDIGDVRLEPIIERLLAIVEPQAAARDLRLSMQIPRGVVLRGDGERVLQILLNLVVNSVKFTPARGTISVSCDPDGDAAVIRVSDTGAGVPDEDRERIFRPYVQLDTPSDSRVAGAGLGLAISRELARAMSGDLTCTEAREGGSVFVLRLPRSMGIAGSG